MSAQILNPQDLITIEFRDDGTNIENDLQRYLEKKLDIRVLVEFVESAHWPLTTHWEYTLARS